MIPEPPELEPPVSPDMLNIPFELGVFHWIIIISVILLLIGAIAILTRKKKQNTIPPTPEQIAAEKIRTLATKTLNLKTTATELSLILRSYFSTRSEDPALFETQQEFNKRVDSLTSLPETLQITSRDLLQEMSSLKYASESPDDHATARELIEKTLQLIENIEKSYTNDIDQAPTAPRTVPFTTN